MSQRGSNDTYEEDMELRRGPWTLEEDTLLIHYIACHGEGRWNLLARCSGLKRSGKSCRLRWLNYLKPDVKRGNLSPEEQILILELHSKWGNRWSRIAQHLPGRTDNEIKNYWRTRVQKQARQLKVDANSKSFVEAVRCFWMPRLLQKMGPSDPPLTPPPPPMAIGSEDHQIQPTSQAFRQESGVGPEFAQLSKMSLEFPASPCSGFYDMSFRGFDESCGLDLSGGGSDQVAAVVAVENGLVGGGSGSGGGLWSMDESWEVRMLHELGF
ncbi:hypothetical protein QJS10_CPA03g00536 [Acorus calamus]|uniref:Uncharacterized protein n=1 Tax=Acorus calamus TaxID=4465 RepID=A0AAV9F8H1_ACOCL|nr:hypothetical protein QJS10_CPA03g00536 [Acorus calamus]